MTNDHQPSSLSRNGKNLLQRNADAARALPDPDEARNLLDFPSECLEAIFAFKAANVIEPVERDGRRMAYRTTPAAHEYIKENVLDATLPCGHSGVRTIDPDETYACTNDECDERFGPDEVEAYFDRRGKVRRFDDGEEVEA